MRLGVHVLGLLAAALALGVFCTPAQAQAPGSEAEDELYKPSETPGETPGESPEAGGATTTTEYWTWTGFPLGGELWVRGEALVPFSTPSRFGDAAGVVPGVSLAWRGFFGRPDASRRTFVDVSLGYAGATFTNDRADLRDFDLAATPAIGRAEVSATYLLAIGRLGAELWRSDRFRVLGWLGAGLALEQRREDFTAPGVSWDDDGIRSMAVGEAGVGVGWLLGRVSLQFSLAGRAILGDDPPLGAALSVGFGIGVHL